MEQSAVQRIQQTYGEKYSHSLMQESKRDVSRLMNEEIEQPRSRSRSVLERLRQAEQKKQAREQQPKKKNRDSWER
jgi:hypothetical protein